MATNNAPVARTGRARRTLGICLLLMVVVLWTASNFLGSTIFADGTYSKPYFVTYMNTSLFTLPLFAILLTRTWNLRQANKLQHIHSFSSLLRHLDSDDPKAEEQRSLRRGSFDEDEHVTEGYNIGNEAQSAPEGRLGLRETAKLSFQFCLLWFSANYFAMACLQYTTVGSTTILTSTSGVWTLLFGALMKIEKFTFRKFLGVLASLIGVILISRVDLTKPESDASAAGEGNFPHKTSGEIALGDAMAAFSSLLYGLYTVVMKKQAGDESRVNMALFFGLVGMFNVVLMWPGFIILHFTGVEPFGFPETKRVWTIVLCNAASSLFSDVCWAYAMLLTTPLVVTVGLSLTIPLSLVLQIFLQGQYASAVYWLGAAIVFLSFLVINHESKTAADDAPGEMRRPTSAEYESIPREDDPHQA
ncbi:hypothetical protein N7468_001182 [Penicillium chermesinum]|uniref:EamA domain-containing protein n=1 Tax=Penicillium chermesinum TaxID=63820 RepID=A0A9W9PG31_9EURO|nr:uncharacterized protein N7468_001182 [Penicillium chermesinum]KAJ5246199.1 hypothetical protein N7468_001182 [Penicillium chermesinum]KAJ6144487.1 hypothetical protein N7470_008382 [Penicillium chermesinum]